MLMHPGPLADDAPLLALKRAPSLADRAADALAEGVASGALRPGQRLIEADLAAMLGVSRVPLQQALKILEVQGIVESAPHRGTRVAAFDEGRMARTSEVRVALERIAFRDAAPAYAADPALLDPLDRIVVRMEEAADRLDWIAVSRADIDFHREAIRASGNEIVSKLWDTLARHIFILFGHEIRDERDVRVLGPEHRRLRDLLSVGDVAALQVELERHILRLQRPRRGLERH